MFAAMMRAAEYQMWKSKCIKTKFARRQNLKAENINIIPSRLTHPHIVQSRGHEE